MNNANLKLFDVSCVTPQPAQTPVRNFLFLTQEACTEKCGPRCIHKKFLAVARCMTADGYVYFADPGQTAVEDDECGVRHLPLKSGDLPHFGDLSTVVVMNDRELLFQAHRHYPDTLAYLFESSAPFLVQLDEDISSPPASLENAA